MTHDEMIAVIQAQKGGEKLEAKRTDWKPGDAFEWVPIYGNEGCFAFDRFNYRIKPEPPKPREYWVVLNRIGHLPGNDAIANSKEVAEIFKRDCRDTVIHVREVLPES